MAETEKNIEYYESLIFHYLSGKSSKMEDSELLSWINKDPENIKHFQSLCDIWNISLLNDERKKISSKKAYENFLRKINRSDRKRTLIWWNAAAAAIFLLLASYFGLQNVKFDAESFSSDSNVITDTLYDGTEVILNKHSHIAYYSKKIKRKRCAVIEGEVFFNVKHDKTNPFYVFADGIIIKVTGTSFNVKSGKEDVIISLIEGSIMVDYNDKSDAMQLKTGESVTINKKSGAFTIDKTLDINNITWKTHELVFNNSNLIDVLARLEEIYNVSFSYNEDLVSSMHFDGRLNTDDLQLIINTLEVTFNLSFVSTNQYIYQINSRN